MSWMLPPYGPFTAVMGRIKPRIVKVFNVLRRDYEYRCSDTSDCYAIGWGSTPEAAYEAWLARFAHCRRERAT